MHTVISWSLFIGQLIAIFIVLQNSPMLLVSIIRSIRFKERVVAWNSPAYTGIIIAIMYLLFVGLPKFA